MKLKYNYTKEMIRERQDIRTELTRVVNALGTEELIEKWERYNWLFDECDLAYHEVAHTLYNMKEIKNDN